MTTFVALLRGINVSGHKKVPMAELRTLAEKLGYANVQTYIQSGNLLFTDGGTAQACESGLEGAIAQHFGFAVDVVVRTAEKWPTYVKGNPFPEASQTEPNLVMMSLAKRPPSPDAVAMLRERARDGERIELAGEALWVHYPGGAGKSKLSPALLDRAAGSPVTARNWRTVQKLAELLGVTA
jgi:uncharacterized protein (DUF1697 family)